MLFIVAEPVTVVPVPRGNDDANVSTYFSHNCRTVHADQPSPFLPPQTFGDPKTKAVREADSTARVQKDLVNINAIDPYVSNPLS